MIEMLDGNDAAVKAICLADVKVIAAYPITPQSPISEKLSDLVEKGLLSAKYLRVESEHSAMSATIGAQLTGIRAATATSSVGLALMYEILGVASGCRVPIVMPVVNRALVSPWSLWCDHQDTMSARDTGWIQIYAEDVQEVLDLLLMAYKIAENKDVLTPVMVCFDGFILSHSLQRVDVPDKKEVNKFLPAYESSNLHLDVNNPMFINNLTSPDEFSEMRYQQKIGFDSALKIIPDIFNEYDNQFDRKYQLIECHNVDKADVVLVTIGSMAGTAKYVANNYIKLGKKVGIVKITVYRPLPIKEIQIALKDIKTIGVVDRSAGLGGNGGPVYTDVCSLFNDQDKCIISFIAGLGGRDINEKTFETIFDQLLSGESSANHNIENWVDTKKDALFIRKEN